ncbi:DUF1592 domain-containing protein [Sphingopyxis sp. USTB-05]|uniref:DUF1592 domain-containing protein n=1 Tax=Sphingopyxis sp. USTB-05 TaxID=2830667 RepID=UPI0020786D8B|nr:DUF1592 domain-containing protein [Sphingopyxis sp. USTB-05]USI77612.1 DUF1592 domain-containing protein [Sphingopyxis sp. USTB-05]
MRLPAKGRYRVVALGSAVILLVAALLLWNIFLRAPDWAAGKDRPKSGDEYTRMVKLSPDQYRQTIASIFGPAVKIEGQFVEPGVREDGLLAVGAGQVSITSAGLEAADAMAAGIAQQVFDPTMRASTMPCKPEATNRPDDKCAGEFFSKVGRLLLRRSLTDEELKAYVAVAAEVTGDSKDFYYGMQVALRNLLIDPQFLFRFEHAAADGNGVFRLTPDSQASRLSFFLWNGPPDAELLDAAENGDLDSASGREDQVERMIASPLYANGVRAFFEDLLGFDQFATLSKDTTLFPKFTASIGADSREQTMRTILDLLVYHDGDYREIFTTRKTFLTPALGAIYRVPVITDIENGAVDPWVPYEFSVGDKRPGILSHISFVALHSHPGRSSPTHRGKALRELLLCQKVPPPPGDVDFSLVQDISSPTLKTARMRLNLHAAQPACAGCHKITDPIGLALENFDAAGEFRTTENGAVIDTHGDLNGVHYKDADGLAKALYNDPSVPACFVKRVYAYATSQAPTGSDLGNLKQFKETFANNGYRVRSLMTAIAVDEDMYRVIRPRKPLPARPVLTAGHGRPVKPASPTT